MTSNVYYLYFQITKQILFACIRKAGRDAYKTLLTMPRTSNVYYLYLQITKQI